MHLRRALLLFAIVLGLAAIAASLTPPPEELEEPTPTDAPPAPPRDPGGPAPDPGPAGDAAELRFVIGADEPEQRTIQSGERAVVTVAVEDPGQVAIEELGLLQVAGPGTPARFDILPARPGRYEITFRPVQGQPERVGVIEVEAA